jgi:hypothetical protein
MMAHAHHVGRKTRCPGCQAIVTISDDGGGGFAAQPAPPLPPAFGEMAGPPPLPPGAAPQYGTDFGSPEINDFDDERPRRSRRKKKGSALPLVLAIVGAILLLGGGTWGALYFFGGGGGGGAELDLVPGNAQVFVHVRVADLLNTEMGKKVLADVKALPNSPLAMMTQATGLEVGDIDRFTFVGNDMDKKDGFGVVAFTKPIDKQKLYSAAPEKTQATHEGKTYDLLGPKGDTIAVYWLDDKTAVAGKEDAVKKCLATMGGKRPTGLLDDSIARAREKHTLVVGIVPPPDAAKNSGLEGGKAMIGVDPAELKAGSLVLDFDNVTKIEAVARLASDATAQTLKKKIDEGLAAAKAQIDGLKMMVPMMLPPGKSPLPEGAVDTLFNTAKEALNSVKASQSGPVLSVSVSINLKAIFDAFGPLIKDNMGKFGGVLGGGGPRPDGQGPPIRPVATNKKKPGR